jgi:hypothetical protein
MFNRSIDCFLLTSILLFEDLVILLSPFYIQGAIQVSEENRSCSGTKSPIFNRSTDYFLMPQF